jgi:hypothetical protein
MHDSIALIKHYIPSLFEIFSPGRSQEKNIQQAYENRLSHIQQSIAEGLIYEAKEALFDLFWDANDGDDDASLKLEFIERTIASLNQRVPTNLKNGIGKICYKMIIDMPEDESKYVTYLSELATLNTFLLDDRITLLSYESKLTNGRPIDFQLQLDGEQCLIEVLTILIDHSKIESAENFANFLQGRLEQKINYKFDQLNNLPRFIVVPVIWCTDGGNFLEYVDIVRRIREEYGFVSYFMIYGKYQQPETVKKRYEFVTFEAYTA